MGKAQYFSKYVRKALKTYSKKCSKDFIYKETNIKRVHILGNGPSLDDSIHLVQDNDDVVMVNFSATTDLFLKLKPKYLCLADPSFFEKTSIESEEQKKEEMFRILNEVTWGLIIVLPFNVNIRSMPIKNEKITFNYVNTIPVDFSVKFLRNWLYKKNYAMPNLQNVVIMGVYAAFQRGYKTILLHGVDSDSYKNICINKDNEMVFREYHYYGAEDRNLNNEKFYGFTTGTLYKRLACEVTMFRAYIDLSNYADYLGIKVLNASPNSMIDAFERYVHDGQ